MSQESEDIKELQGQLSTERRKNTELMYDMIHEIKDILHTHIKEESNIAIETNRLLKDFINGLDALTHKKHHVYVGEKMEEEEETIQFWHKIKLSLTEKLLIGVITIMLSGLGAMAVSYFWQQAQVVHTKLEQTEKTGK